MAEAPTKHPVSRPAEGIVEQAAAKKPAGAQPSVKVADGRSGLLALLNVEQEARDAASLQDLMYLIANETRKLTRARQVFVLRSNALSQLEVASISSLAAVDRNAPVVAFIERVVNHAAADAQGLDATRAISIDEQDLGDAAGASYPFRCLFWTPLRHGSKPAVGGLVLAREEPWTEHDLLVPQRLSAAFAHAWHALTASRTNWRSIAAAIPRSPAVLTCIFLFVLMFYELPMSALAPVEIVARDTFVVTAPIDGVIEKIVVEPNQPTRQGDLLVKLNDTALKNRFEVANRDADVSGARLKQAHRSAFDDTAAMHEIGIARAELELKVAERDFAKAMLNKTEIRAERDGIAIYSDKRELLGRPISVGERILEVANPEMVEARISLPLADVIALTPGASIKLFLDSDPLHPWRASLKRADYKAKVDESDIVSFRVVASLIDEPNRPQPRLGGRGTAQISGGDVPLWLYLFRRPLTALRQWTGL